MIGQSSKYLYSSHQRPAIDPAFTPAALRAVVSISQFFEHVPLAAHHLAILPAQPRFVDGGVERLERLIRPSPPVRFMRAELPRTLNHFTQRAVAASNEISV